MRDVDDDDDADDRRHQSSAVAALVLAVWRRCMWMCMRYAAMTHDIWWVHIKCVQSMASVPVTRKYNVPYMSDTDTKSNREKACRQRQTSTTENYARDKYTKFSAVFSLNEFLRRGGRDSVVGVFSVCLSACSRRANDCFLVYVGLNLGALAVRRHETIFTVWWVRSTIWFRHFSFKVTRNAYIRV